LNDPHAPGICHLSLDDALPIYAAWEKNWGFVPMTERELEATVQSLGQFFDPKLAHFAFVDGNPAGFVLPIPDFNQVLHRAYPRPDRKSTRLNSSHVKISYAAFC